VSDGCHARLEPRLTCGNIGPKDHVGTLPMVDRIAAEALLTRYLAACQTLDLDIIALCFALGAVVIDPTSPVVRGRAQIKRYFGTLYDDLAALQLRTSPLYWQGDEIACRWQGVAKRRDGQVIEYEGVDVFRLTKAPLISRMQAFWDPKDFINPIL
jgi:hypothetical protein